MARRDELREVMRGLVAPEAADEASSPSASSVIERRRNGAPAGASLPFSNAQEQLLAELRDQLRQHAIEATQTEIALALLNGLARRPALCRGLLAEYLTGL